MATCEIRDRGFGEFALYVLCGDAADLYAWRFVAYGSREEMEALAMSL
jgi:hypothetical protein